MNCPQQRWKGYPHQPMLGGISIRVMSSPADYEEKGDSVQRYKRCQSVDAMTQAGVLHEYHGLLAAKVRSHSDGDGVILSDRRNVGERRLLFQDLKDTGQRGVGHATEKIIAKTEYRVAELISRQTGLSFCGRSRTLAIGQMQVISGSATASREW